MIYFADTSVLIKRYINEPGSDRSAALFDAAQQVIVSPTARIESASVLHRLRSEQKISAPEYERLLAEIHEDFASFTMVPWNPALETLAVAMVHKHALRALDSVQLASVLLCRETLTAMLVADRRLTASALREQIPVIDPTS